MLAIVPYKYKKVHRLAQAVFILKLFWIPASHNAGQRKIQCGHRTVTFDNAERDFTKKML